MIIPESRYSSFKKRNSGRKKTAITVIVIVAAVGVGIALFMTWSGNKEKNEVAENAVMEDKSLEELWIDGKYKELSERAGEILAEEPLNAEGLIYNGFACFHLGIAQFTLEDQLPLLDAAVVSLRKALLLKSQPLKSKVHYVLGKAYYHKGRFYMDEAISQIEKSIELGFLNEDSYKYLGLAYSELGMYEKGIEYFLKAVDEKPDETLYLVLGQTYYKLEDLDKSEVYLKRAIEINNDFRVEIKSRFLLGKIYMEREKLDMAENEYNLILSLDSKSADAHYYLGEIYSERSNNVKARAEWRKALEIDPSHYGALLRLY